jgi:TonB family protein
MRPALIAVCIVVCAVFLKAQDQIGKIVFYREPHFAGSNSKPPTVFCDGEEIAHIGNGTYFEVVAPSGLHRCTAESLQHPMIDVTVLSGKDAYVRVEVLTGLRQHFGLVNTTQDEYEKQRTKLKPVKEWSRNSLMLASSKEAEYPATEAGDVPTGASKAANTRPATPKCISCPQPGMTTDARQAGFEGTLILQVVVGADGRARNIEIERSSGYADLDLNTVEVVRTWRFSPALDQNSTPIEVLTPIEITFRH